MKPYVTDHRYVSAESHLLALSVFERKTRVGPKPTSLNVRCLLWCCEKWSKQNYAERKIPNFLASKSLLRGDKWEEKEFQL